MYMSRADNQKMTVYQKSQLKPYCQITFCESSTGSTLVRVKDTNYTEKQKTFIILIPLSLVDTRLEMSGGLHCGIYETKLLLAPVIFQILCSQAHIQVTVLLMAAFLLDIFITD